MEFVRLLRWRAERHPDRRAFLFLADGEGEEQVLSYGALDRRARAVAARLQALGMAGERVLLLFPAGLDYAAGFLGCLYAGAVAVPAYPPTGSRGLPRLLSIVADCEPAGVLTTAALRDRVEQQFRPFPHILVLDLDGIAEAGSEGWREPAMGPETPAFLQYTSGSTSTPKGVEVSHGNLVANERMIHEAFATEEDSVVVSWLPLYHDMGLIGGLLHPLYLGSSCVLLSPIHFLQRPVRWLRAISRYGASVSGGPNFAYDLCARKITAADAAGLDLSRWRVAFNGAEPVRAEALERFAAAFAGAGFRRSAFFPCYGLAESTLLVSGGRSGEEVLVLDAEAEALAQGRVKEVARSTGRQLVSCGRVAAGLDVRIVDPAFQTECPPGTVGEIWIAGASVAHGYWKRLRESTETFAGRLVDGQGPFLRTGDLGFLVSGELFVTGRIKDLILIRGRNLYPQDIEASIDRSHAAVRPGCGAAFAVDGDGEERLVVVQEVVVRNGTDLSGVAAAIRQAVAEEHETQISSLVLVKTGGVPKTTSGKIQRRACRDLFLAGELPVLGQWREGEADREHAAPRTPAEERLALLWEEVLDLPPGTVGSSDSFFSLGGDSVRGTQLLARLEEAAGVEIPLEELFSAPVLADLAVRLEALAAGGEVRRLPLVRVDRSLPLPLTSPQRRLWFLDQLEPGNPAYNLAVSVRLAGKLDPAILAAALTEVVRRHEALRTVFRIVDGAPAQLVVPPAATPLPVLDLSSLPAPKRAAAGLEREGARLPFDLSHGPLLRSHLVRLAPDEHELHLAIHHIVADGWSIGILLREVTEVYAAVSAGLPSTLPELPFQYGDFACWQEARLVSEALAAQRAAWRQRLGSSPPVLALPTDRPRPPVQSHRGAHATRVLPASLEDGLLALAGARGTSLFMTLLAGFQALLYRISAQDDLIVGTAAANRERLELERLIGFFVNTLALRTDLSGEPSFTELLSRARGTTLAALAGREVPFESLVDESQPRRDLSIPPLVQVMLVLQNEPLEVTPPPGLGLCAREVDNGTARFDLAVSLIRTEQGLEAVFKYNSDLFDAVTVERLAGHFERLLAGAVAGPDLRISALPLLSEAELHQVLLEWNASATESGLEESCLHELIEAQVERTPDGVAVVYEDISLTYRELDRRANQLARHLQRMGVKPETLVGVAVERSPELMPGLLGVLKAGGAYLPLDPSYPAERLAYMIEDARIPVLLTQERLRRELPAGQARVLCLDSGWDAIAAESDERPEVPTGPDHPAYAIYTSGSTGRPKGSMIPHRGIVNRLLWMQQAYGLAPGEGVLQKTPVSFDVSVWELFWPLLAGARLVLARPGGHQDSAYLAGLIPAQAITILHFVPSMLQVFLEEPRLRDCTGIRRVIASGEALPRELADRFFSLLGSELHNLYGPTEASVDVTAWDCGGERGERRPVPIGRPVSNVRIHLLDPGGSPVPIGVPGHLHIGGVQLARGYLGRPDLTAERFVPDPFSGPGGRLYATGDLARLRTDGAIEFLGRIDHQVKIRGFRIELGEIEAVLNAHPAVRESVVMARKGSGGLRLVAYLAGRGGERPQADELRAFAAARLPEHMVPPAFVVLPSFPLNPSGKVDRKALPDPDEDRRADAPRVAPRTPLESRLSAMWCEQLGLEEVGVHDDFFALGGDSIQGALFINRLQRELDALIYVMSLFDFPTVAQFADYLGKRYRDALIAAGWVAEAERGDEDEGAPDETAEAAGQEALSRDLAAKFSPPHSRKGGEAARNRPAVFLLSPFRSGSTLLRVMLEGHPRLFAPPELELLGFETLGERRRVFSGRDSFSREGLLRAVMELRQCSAEEAASLVGESEERDEATPDFYRRLQEWAGDRVLVDKTPRYALDLPTLRRAESWFSEPLYVHLVRHPAGTIHSYLEARMHEVYRFPLPPRRQAEAVWRRSHENILEHLAQVPARRQHRLRFEDLVSEPQRAMEDLCRFLGLELDPAVLSPYEGRRMTDGLHDVGRMMGDPRFDRHRRIEPGVADRWRSEPEASRLGEAAWALAERLGYARPGLVQELGTGPRPLPRGHDLPLSFGQQRIWFLERLQPGGSTYHMPAAVRLEGLLDTAALSQACAEIERRHEILRTVFPDHGGLPRQAVREPRAALLSEVDLSALPAPARQAEAERLGEEEAHRPFNLVAGPLWRVVLLRLTGDEHLLRVNLHHIVCDGWSVGILTRELAALYEAFHRGTPPTLPKPLLQYADFAAWQRSSLSGERLEALLQYWRRRLAAPLPVLELPLDRPRPPVQTHRGDRLPLRLPAESVARLKELGRGEGATLFMALVAAFKALLCRYTGQEDLTIGTPVANRNRPEVEGLIGPFVNTVVLRSDLSGDPDFRSLLRQVRQVCAEASGHEDLPFEKLVDELGGERSLDRSPLFPVMLALQNAPPGQLVLPELRLDRLKAGTRSAKFDLTLDLTETEGALSGDLEYNVDLFDASTVERLAHHFAHLVAGVDARRRISDLPLLSEAEQGELVVAWNDTRSAFPAEATVHELFEASARRVPDAVAVSCEGRTLRYGELAARSDRLARHLARLGVGPEVPVGICVERSPSLLIALLAVLKAGGAYVPLDPANPKERLGHILADAGAPVLLTERPLLAALPPQDALVVILDEIPAGAAGEESLEPRRALPENLAYVIYTSGSTGRPKGVEIGHRGVVNYLATMARQTGLGERDVVMAVTTLSFDIAVTELLLPLMLGCRIELVRRETAGDPALLAAALDAAGATCMQATPATWNLLLEGGWQGRPGLKALCGGEALSRTLADRLLPRVERLWNVYGPTETTVWSALHPVGPGIRPVPLGHPLGNTSIHLLGRYGELVPPGVPGELSIGGEGLARGYRGRPDLTAERFLPDPFGGPGARLYRTGDLARRRLGGEIDYLGRLDHQIKIRGFRIEIGEIEAALLAHPAVRQCVVTAPERDADRRLVAYLVADPEQSLLREELRERLREKLPTYMIPSTFILLDQLPLLPSGKVDRKRLPEPGRDRPDLSASYVSPQNENERVVAQVWQEVLGLDRVGIHDNFFDLGGHSLLAAEVHGKLRERMKTDVSLLDLFQHPTVHALAARLSRPEPATPPLAELQDRVRREREASQRRRQVLARQRGVS